MKHKNFYYKDWYLGTLYENGVFEYMINSNHAQYIDVETAIHVLERIRLIGLQNDFDYKKYIDSYSNSQFKDDFEFK